MTIGQQRRNYGTTTAWKNDLAELTDSADTAGTDLVNNNDGWREILCFSVVPPKVLQLSAESAKSAKSVFTLLHRCQMGGAPGLIDYA